ncbi:MAG TPA: hypothetical protein ENJ52_15090 [Aliiroseovarius sp.]|nr:hypothetical protein [Aliiroseovarius sp.]
MAGLSLAAIGAGIGVAVILSALVGLVFGAAVIADTHPDDDDPEAALDAAMASPGALAQLSVLSLAVTLLSGAVTGWLAPAAPYANAALVGATGTVLGLALPAPGFPRRLRIAMALATLPVTLAGAWGLTAFTG